MTILKWESRFGSKSVSLQIVIACRGELKCKEICHCAWARGGDAEVAEVQQVVILHPLCSAFSCSALCVISHIRTMLCVCDITPACIVPCVILLVRAVLFRVPCLILLHPRVPSALGEPVHCSLNAACERPNPVGWSSSSSLPSSSGYIQVPSGDSGDTFRGAWGTEGKAVLSPQSNPKKCSTFTHLRKIEGGWGGSMAVRRISVNLPISGDMLPSLTAWHL